LGIQSVPPSRREIVTSAAITAGVTIIAGAFVSVLVGFPAFWVDVAMTDPTADGSTPTGLPVWATDALLVLVLTILTAIVCRWGEGTWGDTIMELKAVTVSGDPAGRRRNAARVGLVLAIFGVAAMFGRPGVGVVVIVVQWLPALARTDRRSLAELVVGTVPHTTATRRARPVSRPSSTT
jgi:RDD family